MRRRVEYSEGCGTGLILRPVDCHRNGRIVILESRQIIAPDLASSKMTIADLESKIEMNSFNIFGQNGCALSKSYIVELDLVSLFF